MPCTLLVTEALRLTAYYLTGLWCLAPYRSLMPCTLLLITVLVTDACTLLVLDAVHLTGH